MGRDGYRILDRELPDLRRCVIEQAGVLDAKPAERLLEQLAALEFHRQRRSSVGSLLFRPTAATADPAARAIRTLRRPQGVGADFPVGGGSVVRDPREMTELAGRSRRAEQEVRRP